MSKIRYISHAGLHLGRTISGQNSIESLELAARVGFDFCEIDVRQTIDGEIVAIHNESLNATFRTRDGYRELEDEVLVKDHPFNELAQRYVFLTDNPNFRTSIPKLEDMARRSMDCGITLMVHPKLSEHSFVDKVISICTGICGYNGFYLVSETEAVRYALSVHPDLNTMIVVKNRGEADIYSRFKNCILAVSYKHPEYRDLVRYCLSLGCHVESTLNTDVHADPLADVINYDYLSPCRRELYNLECEIFNSREYHHASCIDFGTTELCFSLEGNASVDCCGLKYELSSNSKEKYRIPVILHKCYPEYNIVCSSGSTVYDIRFSVFSHRS